MKVPNNFFRIYLNQEEESIRFRNRASNEFGDREQRKVGVRGIRTRIISLRVRDHVRSRVTYPVDDLTKNELFFFLFNRERVLSHITIWDIFSRVIKQEWVLVKR